MKVHYINILLFALPLNILVGSPHKNPSITPNHPSNTRLLCDCELYAPSNYDNDPEMKEVMEIFDRQTSERFHEYDERMKTTRQKCKDKCDEAIQKIILKDKMEKQMAQQLTTLETKIDTNDIPTCICEKSLADKVEKNCLACGGMLSGGIAPTVGLIGSVAVHVWKPVALKAAIAEALEAASAKISAAAKAAGNAQGMEVVIKGLEAFKVDELFSGISKSFFKTTCYNDAASISRIIHGKYMAICRSLESGNETICSVIGNNFDLIPKSGGSIVNPIDSIQGKLSQVFYKANQAAEAKAAVTEAAEKLAIETAEKSAIEAASTYSYNAIGYSILAILIIVLITVIIYLILRYRRKKKMKKKLQYIKLLEE
ncbi:hypothetical protein PFFVO_01914 [Plasmodium falciparum Vietnam Oak-Knoll (FVO)]|uniref:Surface antigen n=1 Tax=Plasmodium falciparum Vietnam Oak-Knoll (FVO) TaxID=1036723 RepID=A0A024VA46_PLAFA|nr:hypothetical protein PFFVO_01914 [Plasmodium falciparum Vietnam Oak-Knoll (FVO)]